jgi:glucokinase
VSGATGTQRAAGPRIRPHVGLRAGVDIGATKTLVVLRDDADGLLAEAETATPARRGGDAIMDTAAELVRGVLAEVGANPAALTGVGVGAAGVISAGGMVTAAGDSFSGWVGTKIDLELSRRLDRVPVRSENDVTAFLRAELGELGADRPRHALAVAVGTGVGGALLVDGRLLRGGGAGAGEIGHIGDFGDEPCSCGRRGHLEAYAGGRALTRRYAAATSRQWSAERVASSALGGDPVAMAVFERAGRCLGMAIGQATGLLGIDLAILGGGVVRSWQLLERPLLEALRQHPLVSGRSVAIRLSELGERAVALGAVALVSPAPD